MASLLDLFSLDSPILLVTALVGTLIIWLIFFKKDELAGIPGPLALPIIGNVHQLRLTPWESLTDLSKRYGEVYRIRLGSRPVVVLNGKKAIQQALLTQAVDFGGRPENIPTFGVFHSTRPGGVYAGTTYGKGWAFRCKMATDYFSDYATGSNRGLFEEHVTEEVQEFMDLILKRQTSPVFQADVISHHIVVNLNTRLFHNEHRKLDDPFLDEFFRIHEVYWDVWDGCSMYNAFPWLKYLSPGKPKKLRANIIRVMNMLQTYADKHKYEEGSNTDLLAHVKTELPKLKPGTLQDVGLTEDRMHKLINDMFGTGSHYGTLNWCMVYAAAFPELQTEVQKELDSVIGKDGLPTFADRDRLPLTNAFIEEVSRHSATAALPPPHMTTKDTVLGGGYGYAIPEGTMVIVNLYSIYTDPKQWKKPEEFNPRRFLKEDGSLDKEKVGSLLKFGGGIRKCTGWKIGSLDVYLFFAILMHQCTLRFPTGQERTLEGFQFPFGIRAPRTRMEMLQR